MIDSHDLLGAYCTDALEPRERADFERHLSTCAECRAEAAEFREILGALGDTVASTPPADLEDLVVGAVRPAQPGQHEPRSVAGGPATEPASPEPVSDLAGVGRHPRWSRAAPWLAAVAAGFLLFVVGVQVGESRVPEQVTTAAAEQMADVVEVATAPDADVMAVDMMGTTARVVASREMDSGVLLASSLPMPAKGMAYQVWRVMADGETESAGTFIPGPQGYVALVLDGSYRGVAKYVITLEPPGGSASPTGKMLGEVDA